MEMAKKNESNCVSENGKETGPFISDENSLLNVLAETQEKYGYVSLRHQKEIAESFKLPLTRIAETISFYSFLHTDMVGQTVFYICTGAPCHLEAAEKTLREFEKILSIKAGETTEDGKFSLFTCGCLGTCGKAPSVMVDGNVYGPVLEKDVCGFINQFRKGGKQR